MCSGEGGTHLPSRAVAEKSSSKQDLQEQILALALP